MGNRRRGCCAGHRERLGGAAVGGTGNARSADQLHRSGQLPGTIHTGVSELDRVLGGGIVPGSVTLLAGDPGVGKSTLLLEVAHRWAESGRRALYLSGEESAGQIRMRAERTGCTHDEVFLAAESDLQTALGHIDEVRPTLVIVDSVQTMSTTEADGVTGGVTQVRAVTTALTMTAKSTGVAIILVGHVTKDGAIAGPRSLEHLVDVVLHFEGDQTRRSAWCAASRTASARPTRSAVSCCTTTESNVSPIRPDSSSISGPRRYPGTAVTVTLDGKRPLIGEVQALIGTPTDGVTAPRGQRHRLRARRDDHRGAGEAGPPARRRSATSTCPRSAACG